MKAQVVLSHRDVVKQPPRKRAAARSQCSYQNGSRRLLRRLNYHTPLFEQIDWKCGQSNSLPSEFSELPEHHRHNIEEWARSACNRYRSVEH
jgi:hypothetical protein